MKRKSYIFCFVAFVICFISAYIAGNFIVKEEKTDKIIYNEANVDVVKEEETETQSFGGVEVAGYWIKTRNNYIVIYNRNNELIANTEICVDNFSDTDKQILKEGIYVENAEALFRYLESYTS